MVYISVGMKLPPSAMPGEGRGGGPLMAKIAPELKARCRDLRVTATKAERMLWRIVTSDVFAGWRFRRQHPVAPYILDIVCTRARLAVEADGGQHAESRHDARRDAFLREQGWRVLRFWNAEILDQPGTVADIILAALLGPHPNPPPA